LIALTGQDERDQKLLLEVGFMPTIMPEGEALRNAVKWISAELEKNEGKSMQRLVCEAATRFDLSPKNAEFLISFYKNTGD
jgi:hypothetical protein